MSKIEIDFNNLKYNLYELLNVQMSDDSTKIKKNFMKVIKNFHPDKNSDLEEEIYYHIILANQVLLDKTSRKKYDDFINGTAETFKELKTSFSKSIKDVEQYFQNKDTSTHTFNSKIEELNKKHGYNNNQSETVAERFKKIKDKRNDIKIEKEDFKNMRDFNSKYEMNKADGGKFQEQIVEYKGAPQELSTYVIGEQYTSIGDLDKLYVEDSVQSSKFSSLDRAFMLQPALQTTTQNKSTEDKMKEYNNQTNHYKNFKPVDFSNKKFNEWQ
jgi:curved DNA-binding protein CbpA